MAPYSAGIIDDKRGSTERGHHTHTNYTSALIYPIDVGQLVAISLRLSKLEAQSGTNAKLTILIEYAHTSRSYTGNIGKYSKEAVRVNVITCEAVELNFKQI